jgi:predicted membrane-bound mannosyltransferase
MHLQETVAQCGPLRLTGWQGLVLVVLLAAALRVHALGTRCFHGDELLSISMASSSRMAEIQRATAPAWHPPLHYAVPRLLYLAGASTEAQWRIAGVLFGVLTAAVSFLIPWAWGAGRIGFVAGLLTATSPMAVLFSQSVRWHPLVGGMLALGALGLVLAVHRERFWS